MMYETMKHAQWRDLLAGESHGLGDERTRIGQQLWRYVGHVHVSTQAHSQRANSSTAVS